LFGFAYDGDGTNFRITPVQIAGHTLTFHVSHFSGVGAATGTALEAFYLPLVRQAEQPVIAAACGGGQIPNVCDEEDDTVHLLQDLKAAAVPVLRTWFLSGVQPLLNVAADSDAGLDNALTELFVWQGNATSLLCEPANGDCSEFFEPAGFQTFVDNARATLATALTAGINRTGAAVVDDPSLDNLQRLLNLSGTAQLLALEGHAQLALDKLDAGFRAMLEMGIQECRTNRSAGEEKLNQVFLFAQFVEESLLVDFQHAIRSCGITIQPSSANLTFEEQTQFTATLNGFSNTNVTWEVVPSAAGTIDAGGLFTAGTVFSGAFQVRATSVENTNKFAVAVVNVSITSVSVFPETVTLQPGETRQFTALVTGPINSSVTWTATGGTITQTGIFTAGQTAGTFVIEVTSVADPTRSASATVSVIANPAVNFAGVYEGPFQGFDPNDKPDPLVQFRYTITQSGNQLVIVRGPLFNDDERRFVATISGNSFTGFQDGAFSMDSVIVGTLEGNTITGSEDEDINEPSDHATFTVTRVSAS